MGRFVCVTVPLSGLPEAFGPLTGSRGLLEALGFSSARLNESCEVYAKRKSFEAGLALANKLAAIAKIAFLRCVPLSAWPEAFYATGGPPGPPSILFPLCP